MFAIGLIVSILFGLMFHRIRTRKKMSKLGVFIGIMIISICYVLSYFFFKYNRLPGIVIY